MIYGKNEKGRIYKVNILCSKGTEEDHIKMLEIMYPNYKFSTKKEELEKPKKQSKKEEKPQESEKQKLLKGVLYSPYDDDILKIQTACAEKGYYFKDAETVEQLWEDFSEQWCAGWLIVEYFIDEFIRYLKTDDYSPLR